MDGHKTALTATADALERQRALAFIEKLRSSELTSEEEEILTGFEAFRLEHPFSLSSLAET